MSLPREDALIVSLALGFSFGTWCLGSWLLPGVGGDVGPLAGVALGGLFWARCWT